MAADAPRTLLLVNADPARHRLAAAVAARAGWRVRAAEGVPAQEGGAEAALLFCAQEADIAAIGDWAAAAGTTLIACAPRRLAVDAMRAGASDFLAAPLAGPRLAAALAAAGDRRAAGELRPLAEKGARALAFGEIVGSAPPWRTALALAAKAARARTPVLIEGEAGTGKETVARAIHGAGPRGGRLFFALDLAAIAANQAESRLFGHEKGAFPGAFERQDGLLRQAEGSTLLIDGVERLEPAVQARLAAFLESGEVRRIGQRGFKAADVRIVAGVAPGHAEGLDPALRRALARTRLSLPPLRERRGDIAALARHLLGRIAAHPGARPVGITDPALALLAGYGWPGNVRQLHNTLFRAAATAAGPALSPADFPQIAREAGRARRADDYPADAAAPPPRAEGAGVALYRADGHLRPLDKVEADLIRLAIGHYHGRMTEVARRLGIGRSTLYRKLAALGIGDDGAADPRA